MLSVTIVFPISATPHHSEASCLQAGVLVLWGALQPGVKQAAISIAAHCGLPTDPLHCQDSCRIPAAASSSQPPFTEPLTFDAQKSLMQEMLLPPFNT